MGEESDDGFVDQIDPNEIGKIMKTREEFINFLQNDCFMHLPADKYRTVDFMKKVLAGEKKLIPSDKAI
jgi:hypothetical protein